MSTVPPRHDVPTWDVDELIQRSRSSYPAVLCARYGRYLARRPWDLCSGCRPAAAPRRTRDHPTDGLPGRIGRLRLELLAH